MADGGQPMGPAEPCPGLQALRRSYQVRPDSVVLVRMLMGCGLLFGFWAGEGVEFGDRR
jgi:hypothetical protein